MGPLNALCCPIFQRCNLTPILFCKHTHRRDTFDLRILAAHPRSTPPMFQNFRSKQTLQTDLVLNFWVQLTCLPPHRPEAGSLVWGQVGSAVQILSSTIGLRYIRPTCFYPFPPFAKNENEKRQHHLLPASSTSSRAVSTVFHLLNQRICRQFILLYRLQVNIHRLTLSDWIKSWKLFQVEMLLVAHFESSVLV